MLQTLTKKGLKGFTLIELLVVIAIIGLLSTVIAAPITEARKKGRDSKKISDIRAIVTSLNLYADDNNGAYPATLAGLVPRYLPNLPANAATTANPRDKYMYTVYTESSRNVAYHIGVKLEAGNQALADDADCGGAMATANGGAAPCVGISGGTPTPRLPVCSVSCTATNSNYATGDAAGATASDFGSAADDSATQCTAALNNCIYDLVN